MAVSKPFLKKFWKELQKLENVLDHGDRMWFMDIPMQNSNKNEQQDSSYLR